MPRYRRLLLCAGVVMLVVLAGRSRMEQSAQAATATWDGSISALWNATSGADSNWTGGAGTNGRLLSGDSAVFTSTTGLGGLNLNNDLTSGAFNLAGITFNAGAAAFVIGDGTLSLNAGNTFVLTGNVVNNGTNLEIINNPFSMTAVRTFTTTAGGGNITLGGNISGAGGGITAAGPGVLTLSGANSFTGGTTINAGATIRSGANNALADASTITIAGGTLDLAGFSDTVNGTGGNAIYWYTNPAGTFGLTNRISTGAGTLTLGGNIGMDSDVRAAANIISGNLNLGAATRTIQNNTDLPSGGTRQSTTVTISANISGGVGAGITSTNNGSGPATALTLSGNNTYTGDTTISNGYIRADSATALGIGGLIRFNGGTSVLQYTANSAGTDWATRFRSAGNAIRLDTNGQTVTLAGIIDNSNSNGLTKLGAGTLVLAGANTYTGTTTVNEGTLLLDKTGSGAIVSTSALTLGGGTFSLKGAAAGSTAQTLGNLTINAGNDQIVLDSNGGTGTNLTLGNTWTRNAGGTLAIDRSIANTTLTSTGGLAAGTQTSTQASLGYATVKDATGTGFAANVGGSIVRYTGADTLLAGSSSGTTNYKSNPTGTSTSGSPYLTLTALNPSYNSLSIDTAGATGANFLDLNGNTVTLTQLGLLMSGANALTIQNGQLGASGSEVIVHQTGAGALTVNSYISGGGGVVTKTGAGTMELTASNVYSGNTNINAGMVSMQNGFALGTGAVTVSNGAALQMQGNIVTPVKTLNLSGSGISSDGALRNVSGYNIYTGQILPGRGADDSLAVRINADAGSTLGLSGSAIGSTGVRGYAVDMTIGGNGNTWISGAIHTLSGSLTKEGTGNLQLLGANAFTGGMNINGGTVTALVAQTVGGTNVGPFGRSGTISFGGGTLQYSPQNNVDYSSRFSTAASQAIRIDTNSRDVTFATALTSSGGSLTKSGFGKLTITAAPTYTGGTTVNSGTLLLSGALNMPATGALTVNAGGTFSLADGTARNTTAASVNLASGATLVFDWNAAAQDNLASTAAATTAGIIGIQLNNTSPSGAGGTLLSSSSGGLTSGGATYYLANNSNFSALLTASDTAVSIGTQTSLTALTNNAFWIGNKLAGTNTSGVDNAMALSNGFVGNWSTTSGSYTATALVPGSTANVVFSATGATQQSNIVLGADMTFNTVTFNDTTPITINGPNALTLLSTGTGTSSAISTNQDATISAGLILGANQTWTTAASKTLTIGGPIGNVTGGAGLTIAGTGTSQINGTAAYSGATTVNNGATLTFAVGSSKTYLGTGNTLPVNGVLNVAGNVDVDTQVNNGVVNVTSGGTLTIRNANGNQDANAAIGNGGYGMLNITGGTVNVLGTSGNGQGSMNILNGGSQGLLRITGGTLNIGQLMMFRNGGGVGEVTITGGTLNKQGTAGLFDVSDRGSFNSQINIAGGLVDNTAQQITLGRSGGTAGSSTLVFNFDAGTMLTREFTGAQGSSQYIINFNGGTIKASPNISTTAFTPAAGAAGSLMTYVNGAFGSFNGGIVFDTNGQNAGLNSNLLAPTGNGVTSLSLATGGSGYTGAPTVTISDAGAVVAGTSTSGSNTITALSPVDIAKMFVGQSITGTGIPAGTIITAVGTSSVTMSQNATANNLGQTVRGQGATAYANISGGVVTGFVVTNPGVGYIGTVTAALGGGFGTGGSGTAATLNAITPVANTIGGGGLTKNGAGTLTLSGLTTYTGATTINAGTLAFGNTITNTYASNISGVGAVSQTGTGTTILTGNNNYTGVTTLSAGVLRLDSATALPGGIGVSGGTSALTFSGGVLGLGAGDFTRNLAAAGTVTAANFTGAGGWAAYGADRLVNLGGVSFPIDWGTANTGFNGQTLILSNATATHTVEVQNPIVLGTAARTVQTDNGSASVDGKLSGLISGGAGGNLNKTGAGTLELSANNTYSGATNVNAGTLIFSGDNSGSASAVTVAANAIGQFNALNSIPSSGRTVTDTGTVVFGPAFGAGNIPAGMLRITTVSTGAVAADNYSSTNFDFQAAGLTAASLGAVGNVTYTGTLTPNGTTYRLGGGGGTLTMANTNALTGANSVAISSPGTVVLAALNNNTGATTINASATLQLGTGATGQNGSVGGHIVNNGTALAFSNFDNQDFDCIVSGTGPLVKNGAGTLTINSKQTYAGATTVNAGTLLLAGGANTLAANKTLTVNGGTLDLGATSQYVGSFTGTGGSIIGSGTLTTNPTGAGTYAGSIGGTANLTKVAGQTLTLTADNTTSGTVKVIGGGLTLKDSGKLSANTGITVTGNATLSVDNTGTSNINGRVNSASFNLDSGVITYLGANSTASTETFGAVALNSGVSLMTATPGSGTASAVLTLTSLTRSTGAVLNVNQGNSSNLGTSTNPFGRILVTGGPVGNVLPVNGVVPGVTSSQQDNWNLVGYNATTGFGILGLAGYPTTTATFATAGPTDNLTAGGAVGTGGKTINSINQGTITFTNGTASGGPDLLTINSGMAIMGTQTFGTTSARGRVTSGTQELFILHRDGNATPSPIINSVIENNGNPVSLVVYSKKGDRGPYLELTAANTYSGGTFVTGGNAQGGVLLNAGSATVVIPAGGLTINNLGIVDEAGFQGQLDSSNVVTINGGGQLRLMGTNTLAGIVFNSNGGTTVPAVLPFNTITRDANTNNYSIFGGGGGTLTITGNISSTPTNVAVTPIIGNATGGGIGILDFGFASHDITVSALPQGNLANSNGTLTPLNGLTINSVIQGSGGGVTKKGTGVLNLTGANTFSGQLTVEEGVLNVATVNNVSTNGVLGNSALAVIMGGSSGKVGTLEYTGGTTASSKPFTMATGGSGGFQVDAAATNLTLSGVINGSGGLIKTGQGTLTLTNSFNVYSGGTTVNAGTLTANASGTPLGATTGTLAVNNPNIVDATTAVILNLSTSAPTTTGTLSGFIDCATCGSTATINVAASQLFTVNQMTDATYEGIIAGGATSAFTLGSLSTSKLILTGNSTYDGPTNILAGTLLVNGDNSAANGAVTVAPAGTLGGTGIVGGHTNVLGTHSPGNSPGIETFVGNLTYSGGASVVNWELIDDTVTNAPNPNALFDTILVGGNLDFAGLTALVLDFDNAGTPEVDWTDSFWTSSHLGTSGWLLYDVAGTTSNLSNLNITVANWQDGNGALFNTVLAGSSFSLIQDGQDVYLNFTAAAVSAVPEPGTFALALLGLLGLGCYAWRRRR